MNGVFLLFFGAPKPTHNPTDAQLGFIPTKPIISFSQLVHWRVLIHSKHQLTSFGFF